LFLKTETSGAIPPEPASPALLGVNTTGGSCALLPPFETPEQPKDNATIANAATSAGFI
jgi:hypothetical protein